MKIEDLEKYRDEEGFINMDEVLASEKFETLKETRGSQNREKFWITLDDSKIMLRTSNLESQNVEYTNYAELIVEELAKQVDIPCAHYDLIKYKGQKGVFTKSVLEREHESLILAKTLLDQIETEEIYDENGMCITDLIKSYNNFRKYDDITREQVEKMCEDTEKIAIFETFTMATDSHPENIGYVYYFDGEQKTIKLSPLFDNEHSLMLEQPMEIIDEMLSNKIFFKEKVEDQYQAIFPPQSERIRKNMKFNILQYQKFVEQEEQYENLGWEYLLYYLCDNSDESMDFAERCVDELNIQEAIKKVEERIHTKLPDKLKVFVNDCFDYRKKMIEKNLLQRDEVELW